MGRLAGITFAFGLLGGAGVYVLGPEPAELGASRTTTRDAVVRLAARTPKQVEVPEVSEVPESIESPAPDVPFDEGGLTDDEWGQRSAALEAGLPADRGAIHGTLQSAETGDELAGVTVVVAGPALTGELVVISDERGYYQLPGLPAGTFTVTFYYASAVQTEPDIEVKPRQATVLRDVIAERSLHEIVQVVRIDEELEIVDELDTVAQGVDP